MIEIEQNRRVKNCTFSNLIGDLLFITLYSAGFQPSWKFKARKKKGEVCVMIAIRGLVTCVGYADLLAITLIRNMRHLTECWVITSPEDEETQEICRAIPGVHLSITNVFTEGGAYFNKGRAIETAGFDVMGRDGWILIWDADILFPDELPFDRFIPGSLYGCRRRSLKDTSRWESVDDWRKLPFERDGGPIGYFQLFRADDPAIKDKRPWYDVSFTHAGGGDCYFCMHWAGSNRRVLPFDVLHLGERDRNWFGTTPEARDMMAAYITINGWSRPRFQVDETVLERVGNIIERVEVPGYPKSDFELPFCKKKE